MRIWLFVNVSFDVLYTFFSLDAIVSMVSIIRANGYNGYSAFGCFHMVILIDIGKEELMHCSEELMYVGASRAKYKLILIATLDDSEYTDVLTSLNVRKTRNPEKAIATSLNAKYKEILMV